MKLLFDLPDPEKSTVSNCIGSEKILFCTPTDLDITGKFSKGYIVITAKELIYIENNMIKNQIIINSGKEYKSVAMVGNGLLQAEFNGEVKIIARYTMRHVPRYASIASALNQLAETKNTVIKSKDDEDICPKCGRKLDQGSKVCPNCINKGEILKRLWEVVKPNWLLLLFALLLFWAATGVSLATPYIQRLLIDNCLQPSGNVQKLNINVFLFYIGALVLCKILNSLISYLKGVTMVKVGSSLSAELRNMVYSKIQILSISYLSKLKTGDLMNRVTRDTERIKNFIQNQLVYGANQILILVGVCIILFYSNWKLALMIVLPAPLVAVFIRISWRSMHVLFARQWKAMDKANSLLQDILSGMRVVKVFGMEQNEVNRFKKVSKDVADTTSKSEGYFSTLSPIMSFFMGAGQFFVVYYGGRLVLGHQMKLGELVQFIQYTAMLYGPLDFMSFLPRMLADVLTAVQRVFEVIDSVPEMEDADSPEPQQLKGAVTLKNISFGYQSHEPVLDGIDMDVSPGEMIGLVGHSGAGKSTLINLIMRLYDVDNGQILIDGVDIKDIPQQDLRSQIGVVLQETFLFSGTILDNIRYSNPNATLEEIITAAKVANAHDFIVQFPDGYDTRVGENGYNLSGGERQRIAIARAILHNPKILILDEATASLDIESEQQIQQALGRLIKGRTTFAIAHRLSTLKNANRLLVIDKGKKAELGTHEELLRSKGIYYKLVMAQRQMTKVDNINKN